MSIRVLESLGSTLLQDAGRPGLSNSGVGPSGVFDRRSFRHANTLLGNEENAAVLEHMGGVLKLMSTRDHAIVVTGAIGPITLDGAPVEVGRVVVLKPHSVLTIGAPVVGLRYLIGVAGGFDVPAVLGSRSYDTLAHLGPEPITNDTRLSVGISGTTAWSGTIDPCLPSKNFHLRLSVGPRNDWFTAQAISTLFTTSWGVDSLSGRVGIRLDGPPLERARFEELLSEGVVRGSIQVTNSGMPIILGPDHPVTGGYPVIAVVIDADTDVLAHLKPGDNVTFSRHSA